MIYKTIVQQRQHHRKLLALLIDPDKGGRHPATIQQIVEKAAEAAVDFIFVGGSLISTSIDTTVKTIKQYCRLPVILFPGSALQVSPSAEAILLLSLISGRNPEFLIGNHVTAAPFLRQSGIEILPTGYMLIESGITTSAEYISNTKPIPRHKTDIAVATAVAGEMLGLKMLYLDAGSGAQQPVPPETIAEVRRNVSVPLIVGGGLRNAHSIELAATAGADIIVLGTIVEEQPGMLKDLSKVLKP